MGLQLRSGSTPSAAGQAGHRGPWAASTAYKAGETVIYRGVTYARKTDGTSATTFTPASWYRLGRAQLSPVLCSTRNEEVGAPEVALSNGTDTGGNYRRKITALAPIGNAVLRFWNGYTGTSYDVGSGNAITVSASIEETNGRLTPIRWSGATSVSIADLQIVDCDPVALDIEAGSQFYVRTFVSVTSGQKWPTYTYCVAGSGDSFQKGTSETDQTQVSGVLTTNTAVPMFGPIAVYAIDSPSDLPGLIVVGDSISVTPSRTNYLDQALDTASIPHLMLGRLGDSFGNWSSPSTLAADAKLRHRRRMIDRSTHAIIQFGRNDITGSFNLSQMQTAARNVAKMLRRHGIQWIAITTVTPKTTSTDSWATVGNQTQASAPQDVIRDGYNDWLLAVQPEFDAVFDVAAAVQAPGNRDVFGAGLSTDGTHLSTAGNTAAVAAIDTSKIVL